MGQEISTKVRWSAFLIQYRPTAHKVSATQSSACVGKEFEMRMRHDFRGQGYCRDSLECVIPDRL